MDNGEPVVCWRSRLCVKVQCYAPWLNNALYNLSTVPQQKCAEFDWSWRWLQHPPLDESQVGWRTAHSQFCLGRQPPQHPSISPPPHTHTYSSLPVFHRQREKWGDRHTPPTHTHTYSSLPVFHRQREKWGDRHTPPTHTHTYSSLPVFHRQREKWGDRHPPSSPHPHPPTKKIKKIKRWTQRNSYLMGGGGGITAIHSFYQSFVVTCMLCCCCVRWDGA